MRFNRLTCENGENKEHPEKDRSTLVLREYLGRPPFGTMEHTHARARYAKREETILRFALSFLRTTLIRSRCVQVCV